jgi:hypothetical protein
MSFSYPRVDRGLELDLLFVWITLCTLGVEARKAQHLSSLLENSIESVCEGRLLLGDFPLL